MIENLVSGYTIRKAEPKDAEAFCGVIRTSITALCKQDHKNDVKLLGRWLENKTVENCEKWINMATATLEVAVVALNMKRKSNHNNGT